MENLETIEFPRIKRTLALVPALLAVLFIATGGLFMGFGAPIALRQNIGVALVMLGVGLILIRLGVMMWAEAMNTRRWRISISADALDVVLPRGRTFVHDVSHFSGRVPRESITTIVTRLEGYKSMGVANLQRTFALQLTDGSYLHLGEDRAIGTNMYQPFYENCVQAIAERHQLALADLGMVTTGSGFVGTFGVKVPDWNALPADEAEVANVRRRVRRTGYIMLWIGPLILLLAFLNMFA